MGDSLMASVSAALLKKVLAIAANEIILYFGFKKHLSTLKKSLQYIQAVVRDAEQKQLTSDAVRIWVKDLKDVADRAELVLDEIDYEILRRKVGAKSSSNPIVFRYRMARKMKNINDSFARFKREAADHNLQQLPIPAYKRETDSFLDEFGIVGREGDAEVLIPSLIRSSAEKKPTIIPIVGMGGIGKTTLAKLIYNDMQIKGHFDVRVWVCVGVKVDGVLTILLKILESLPKSKVEFKTRENVIKKLNENLGGKKYLLVIDDVWNEEGEFWADFRSCMFKVNEAYGNSIIVTTRSMELSTNACQTSVVHSLDHLSDGQCWSIIKERAFPIGSPSEEDLVGSIGKEIARMCCGLPLAAKVVGGMLRSKNGVEEWLSVRDSLDQGSSQEDPVLHILKLSYYNLPNPLLKHCFSYCSIFRKDAVMEKTQLIQLWMALGFLEVEEGARHKDMEDVGHEFFNTLVQNSLFQDVEKDDYGNITGCKMHDLACSISGSQCLSLEGPMSNDAIPRVKDLALYAVNEEVVVEVLKQEKARYLRMLFLGGAGCIIIEHMSLNHFKCLRILILNDSGLTMLSDSIGELIHLRYLDLSYNKEINVLPRSIGKLYHLQTLRLSECSFGLKFPNEVGNLINLRHLYIDEERNIAPFNIGRFTCLQTLEYFGVGKEKGHCIEVLGPLKNLRGMLKLDNLQNVSSKREAMSADLIGKLGLNRLKYAWCDKGNHGGVLEGLQAPPNLKVLKIQYYWGENFPEWVMKMAVIGMDQKLLPLHNLVYISFFNCGRCEHVPMLGQLPHLQKLEMRNMDNVRCIDESFYGYIGGSSSCGKPPRVIFPALRRLKMSSMDKLETWMDVNVTRKDTIGGGEGSSGSGGGLLVFPHLVELELIDCHWLNSLPYEAFTGAHLSLKCLVIDSCCNLGTIPTLQGFTSLEELMIGPLSSKMKELCFQSILRTPTSSHSPSPSTSSSLQQQLQSSPILRKLTLRGQYGLDSIPEEVQHLTALTSLTIYNFLSVEALPDWFAHLSSLEELHLYCCEQLRSLPSTEAMGRLTKLKTIKIQGCYELSQRLAERSGAEWSKVSHIPDLRI